MVHLKGLGTTESASELNLESSSTTTSDDGGDAGHENPRGQQPPSRQLQAAPSPLPVIVSAYSSDQSALSSLTTRPGIWYPGRALYPDVAEGVRVVSRGGDSPPADADASTSTSSYQQNLNDMQNKLSDKVRYATNGEKGIGGRASAVAARASLPNSQPSLDELENKLSDKLSYSNKGGSRGSKEEPPAAAAPADTSDTSTSHLEEIQTRLSDKLSVSHRSDISGERREALDFVDGNRSTSKAVTSGLVPAGVELIGSPPEPLPEESNRTETSTLDLSMEAGRGGVPGAWHQPGLDSEMIAWQQLNVDGGEEASTSMQPPPSNATRSEDDFGRTPEALARASLVDGSGSPRNLPVAQPDFIGDRRKKERPRVSLSSMAVGLTAVTLVLAAILGGVFGTRKNRADPVASVSSHEDLREGMAATIWYQIARASRQPSWLALESDELLLSSSTLSPPHLRAFHWLLFEDPLELPPGADNLLQRYFAVYLYFSTTSQGPWTSCNPGFVEDTSQLSNELCYYMQYVTGGHFDSGYYNHWQSDFEESVAAQWLSSHHECQWAGLFCNGQRRIEYIHLDKMSLTGTLPPEVSLVEDLISFSLLENSLQGSIPSHLFSMPALTFLDLSSNQFTGSLPEGWWRSNLESLNLNLNPLSVGNLPSEIGLMSNLRFLHLTDSGITGPIPSEVYSLTKLDWLILRWNDITGTIATEIGQLSDLTMFSLQRNAMTGNIPSEVGLLSTLLELDLHGLGLTSTIPEEIYLGNLEHLNALILGENFLTGTVSSHIANLKELSFVLLQKNPFLVGPLPSELGLLTGLKRVDVDRSGLTGAMPMEICVQRADTHLYRLSADCLPLHSDNSTIPMPCPRECCTKCCERDTKVCVNYDQ